MPEEQQDASLPPLPTIIVRAISHEVGMGWIMGDDVRLTFDDSREFNSICTALWRAKGIHPSRQQWTDLTVSTTKKVIGPKMYQRSIRSLGVRQNSLLGVTPLSPNAWVWEPLEYYEARTVQAVRQVLEKRQSALLDDGRGGRGKMDGDKIPWSGIALFEIEKEIAIPPPLREMGSLRALLRKYPEEVSMEHRTQTGETFVRLTKSYEDLPRWM